MLTHLKDLTEYCDYYDIGHLHASIKPPQMTYEQYAAKLSYYCNYRPDGTFDMNFVKRSWWCINDYGLLMTRERSLWQCKIQCPLMSHMIATHDTVAFVYLDGDITNIKASNLMTLTDIAEIDYATQYPNALTWTNVPLTASFIVDYETANTPPHKYDRPEGPFVPSKKLTRYQRYKIIKHYTDMGFLRSRNFGYYHTIGDIYVIYHHDDVKTLLGGY